MKTYKLSVSVTGTLLVADDDPFHAVASAKRAIEGGHLNIIGKPMLGARAVIQVDGEIVAPPPTVEPEGARPGKVSLQPANVDLRGKSVASIGSPGSKRKDH